MNNPTQYLVKPNVTWKLLKDSVVAVNLDNGVYFTFNPTASLVWKFLEQGKTFGEILSLFQTEFPGTADETLRADIAEVITTFVTDELVTEKTTTNP